MDFIDEYGLPLHWKDAGDAPANLSRIAILKWLNGTPDWNAFEKGIKNIHLGLFKFQRHPIQKHDLLGSDQLELMFLILFLHKWTNYNMYFLLKKLGFPNGDCYRPHHESIWGRILDNRTRTYLGDFCLLLFVLFRRLAWIFQPKSVSNDCNLECIIRVFQIIKPTWLIRLIRKIYNPKKAITYYFNGEPYSRSPLSKYVLNLYYPGSVL